MPISRLAMAVLPILLVSSPFAQAASEVPDLDIGPSCRAAATAGISADRSEDACRRDENRARDELQRKWPGFAAAEQARCTSLSHRGGSPSYVELLRLRLVRLGLLLFLGSAHLSFSHGNLQKLLSARGW